MNKFGLSTLRFWLQDESIQRVYRNAGILFRGRILAGIISLLYLSIAAKTLGVAQFGVLVLINLAVGTIGELAVFPGWHSVIRYGSLEFRSAPTTELKKLLSFASLLELSSGFIGVLVAACITPFIAPLLGIPEEARHLLLLFSLAALASARSTPSAILYLNRKYNTLAMQQALAGVVRLVGAIIAYLTESGLAGFVYAWLIAILAESAFMWIFAMIELHRNGLLGALLTSPSGVSKSYPGIWRFSIATKFNKSLEDISPRITPLAVGFILEPIAVGLFHIAFRLGMLLSQPAISLVGTVYPELTRLATSNDLAGVRRVVFRSGVLATTIGLPFFLVYLLFGNWILEWVGGIGFGQAHAVLVLITGSQVIQLLGFQLGSALQAMGRPGVVFRVNLITMIVLIPVLIVLLQQLGLAGAGLYALVFSTLVVSVLGILWWRQPNPAHTTPGTQ